MPFIGNIWYPVNGSLPAEYLVEWENNARVLDSTIRNIPKTKVQHKALSGYIQNAPVAYEDRTYQIVTTAESDFNQIRIGIRNNLAVSRTISSVTACANETNSGTPSNTLIPLTFGGSTTATLPPRNSENVPSILYSDWVNIESVPRSDSGTLPLVLIRVYIDSGEHTQYGNTSTPNGDWLTGAGLVAGRMWDIGSSVGDQTLNQSGSLTDPNWGCPAIDIQFKTKTQSVNVVAVGDSITNGDSSGGDNMESPVHFACTGISTPERPVTYQNRGFSAQVTDKFEKRIDSLLPDLDASILVYSSFSPNDVSLAPADDASRIQAIEDMKPNVISAIMDARSSGVKLILTTGLPFLWSTAVDNARKDFNLWVKSLENKYDIFVADFDALLSDGATPATIQDIYTIDDLHPNTLGYQTMGTELGGTINSMLNWLV
jgi:lysophospholipase L1-like esterase